jgi:integrase
MRLTVHNAAADAPTPRTRRKPVPVLTPADAQRLLSGLRGDRLEALYVLALGTGLRQGELLGLRWRDVDLEHETVTVGHQLQRADGTWRLSELKADRPPRVLGIDPLVAEVLREHRVRQGSERLAAGERWRDPIPDLVFRNSVGSPLDGPTVTHRFQRALDRAGLPRMRFQDLRHGAASLLLAQGVHARVVMEQLGHSQISLTMNTYTHVASELQREAARRLGTALGGTRQRAADGAANEAVPSP